MKYKAIDLPVLRIKCSACGWNQTTDSMWEWKGSVCPQCLQGSLVDNHSLLKMATIQLTVFVTNIFLWPILLLVHGILRIKSNRLEKFFYAKFSDWGMESTIPQTVIHKTKKVRSKRFQKTLNILTFILFSVFYVLLLRLLFGLHERQYLNFIQGVVAGLLSNLTFVCLIRMRKRRKEEVEMKHALNELNRELEKTIKNLIRSSVQLSRKMDQIIIELFDPKEY